MSWNSTQSQKTANHTRTRVKRTWRDGRLPPLLPRPVTSGRGRRPARIPPDLVRKVERVGATFALLHTSAQRIRQHKDVRTSSFFFSAFQSFCLSLFFPSHASPNFLFAVIFPRSLALSLLFDLLSMSWNRGSIPTSFVLAFNLLESKTVSGTVNPDDCGRSHRS